MKELIRITEQDGNQVVSGSDLHNFVARSTRFDIWMKRMLDYGFAQGVDYQCLYKNVQMPNGGTKEAVDDYALTLDCAKQIAMLQKNDKGMQARTYFIEVEKKWKQSALPDFNDPVAAARAWADAYEAKQLAERKAQELAPKAEYAEEVLSTQGSFAITHIAKELGMSARKLNVILREKGVQHKVGGTWVLNRKYEDKGFTRMGTQTNVNGNGETFTTHHTYWTERGRKFVHELLGNTQLSLMPN